MSHNLLILRAIADFGTSSASPGKVFEYEVFAESPLNGTLQYGPFTLIPWDPHDIPAGTRRSLILRFEAREALGSEHRSAKKKGFYHGVDLPTEFCVIASTLLRRRLTLGPLLRMGNTPLRQPSRNLSVSGHLAKGSVSATTLRDWLSLLIQLPEEDQAVLGLAARMYHEALSLLDTKPDVSYLLLVSCIEVFVGRLGKRKTREDFAPNILGALDSCTDEARAVLEKRLLETDRGIGKFFVEFILEHTTADFWNRGVPDTPATIRKSELERLLKKVYNQRSKTLHEGQPFPPNIVSPDELGEIDRREDFSIGEKRWTKTDFIPYVSFFERLVHHVVVEFLRRQIDSSPSVASPVL